MKIIFDGYGVGFANNGGTKTLFTLADKLCEKHDVEIWSCSPNRFDWFKLNPKIKYSTGKFNGNNIDILIMCGFRSYEHAVKHKADIRINWIRGWETWSNKEKHIVGICKDTSFKHISNSIWIKEHLENNLDVKCGILYTGLEKDKFFDENIREHKTIGFLNTINHNSPKKGFNISEQIAKILKKNGWKIIGYGNPEKHSIFDEYICRPNYEQKRNIYSKCNLWLVTSTNEGLHIPPMESVLCGTPVMIPEYRTCGCYDWFIDDENLKYKSVEECVDKIMKYEYDSEYIERSVLSVMDNIGFQDTLYERFFKCISE